MHTSAVALPLRNGAVIPQWHRENIAVWVRSRNGVTDRNLALTIPAPLPALRCPRAVLKSPINSPVRTTVVIDLQEVSP